LTRAAGAAIVSTVTVRHAVTYGAIPYGLAVYTCVCGGMALEPRLARAPEGWATVRGDVHLCPGCAAKQRAEPEEER
jgi:hypothetical protein